MAVERNENGSVTIRDENGIVTIGKISAVFTPEFNSDKEAKHQAWVESCAQMIKAQPHTISEVEEYFLKQCEAIPLDAKDIRMRSSHINVVMKHQLKDRYDDLQFRSLDLTDEEFEELHRKQNELHKEVMNSSPEDYGLIIKGYYLPRTLRNQQIYEEKDPIWERLPEEEKLHYKDDEEICVYFEETTGYMSLIGRGAELRNRLIAYKGITDKDINSRNSNFHIYISTLRDLGYLPMEN